MSKGVAFSRLIGENGDLAVVPYEAVNGRIPAISSNPHIQWENATYELEDIIGGDVRVIADDLFGRSATFSLAGKGWSAQLNIRRALAPSRQGMYEETRVHYKTTLHDQAGAHEMVTAATQVLSVLGTNLGRPMINFQVPHQAYADNKELFGNTRPISKQNGYVRFNVAPEGIPTNK